MECSAAAWIAAAALPPECYRQAADVVARSLLGTFLVRELAGEVLVARIVETEAYLGAPDRASHAWAGRHTARNHSLYLAGGHAYVYFIYGMHFCLNAVTGDEQVGSAVLLRAAEPVLGATTMRRRRGLAPDAEVAPGALAGGPGRLCQALGVDRTADGVRLDQGALRIVAGAPGGEVDGPAGSDAAAKVASQAAGVVAGIAAAGEIVAGPRIGVGYAGEAASWPLRFALAGNPHVSRPRPPGWTGPAASARRRPRPG